MAADDDLRRVLIDAKLSGTNKQIGDEWGYAFRTNEQAAEALGVSPTTADNDWAYAKSWLQVELADADQHQGRL